MQTSARCRQPALHTQGEICPTGCRARGWARGPARCPGLAPGGTSSVSGPAEKEAGTHCHFAPEQSPTRRFCWLGQCKLTQTPHRPEEVTTLSTSSSCTPPPLIYILITFLGKPSRPHSAWQAAGKTHRALWQRWRGQACRPAKQQPWDRGTSLPRPAWIPQPGQLQPPPRSPSPAPHTPTSALLTPVPISSQTYTCPTPGRIGNSAKSNAHLPFPKASERAALFFLSLPQAQVFRPQEESGKGSTGPVRPWGLSLVSCPPRVLDHSCSFPAFFFFFPFLKTVPN